MLRKKNIPRHRKRLSSLQCRNFRPDDKNICTEGYYTRTMSPIIRSSAYKIMDFPSACLLMYLRITDVANIRFPGEELPDTRMPTA